MNKAEHCSKQSSQHHSLILAEPEDVHVKQVLHHAADYPQLEYTILDTKAALCQWRTSLRFNAVTKRWEGSVNGISLSSIHSIWYRRPGFPSAQGIAIAPEMRRLAEEEMQGVLQNFYRVLGCRILPPPAADREADYKLRQLQVAATVGLAIPQTFLSNQAEWLAEIPPSIDCFCIKGLAAYHWWINDHAEYALRSARVTRQELVDFAADAILCPTLVQEYVEKRYEWRVTVVNRTIFACRLDSQKIAGARDDWRQIDVAQIPHAYLELPTTVAAKLLCYLDYFNLNFGAFDLIETSDGTFVFLECNPNGQWLWIELLTGAPISKAIADYLFGQ